MKDTGNRLVNIINTVYETEGFCGVISEVYNRLQYGNVVRMNGLYRITTGGYSEDEWLVHALFHPLSKFKAHYCGYITGGAFYFSEERYTAVEMVRMVIDDD